MPYQLSDMNNGPFATFKTAEEAEAELESIVGENLDAQKQAILETIENWESGAPRPAAYDDWDLAGFAMRVEAGEDLGQMARESKLAFHEISEIQP